MGKSTFLGSVPADDPMFGRVEFFNKISTQPKSQKLKHAKRITVVWEGQDVHLDLTTELWDPIQSGKKINY